MPKNFSQKMQSLKKETSQVPASTRWEAVRDGVRSFGVEYEAALADYDDGRIRTFADLRIVTSAIRLLEDHRRYESCIHLFDHELAFPDRPRRRCFVGSGVSGGSLNTYRLVEVGERRLLEKVYLSKAPAFSNMLFVHTFVLPRVRGLSFPLIHEIRRGNALSAVYFDFIDARPNRVPDLAFLSELLRAMAEVELSDLETSDFMRSFRRPPFVQGRQRIRAAVAQDDPEGAERIMLRLRRWQQAIARFPQVLNHGDLHPQNVLGRHVIDWDWACLAPFGHDAARIANRTTRFEDLAHLEAFFREHFERRGAPREDIIAFLFFFLHFMQIGARPRVHEPLFHQIMKALEAELG